MNKEDIERIRKEMKEFTKDFFNPDSMPDFEEKGVLSGSEDSLFKDDGEVFPDESELHSPEDRRKNFKVHKGKTEE